MKFNPEGLVTAVVVVGAVVLIGTLGPVGALLSAGLWLISKKMFTKE